MRRFFRTPAFVAMLVGLACALTGVMEPLNHILWNVYYRAAPHHASDLATIVKLESSTNKTAGGRWSTGDIALLLAKVEAGAPRRIFIDATLNAGLDPRGDMALRRAIDRARQPVTFVARSLVRDKVDAGTIDLPARSLIGRAPVAVSVWNVNFLDVGISAPYAVSIGNRQYPTFSAELAGVRSGAQDRFYPDFSVDPDQIPTIAAQVIELGRSDAKSLREKTVIISDEDAPRQIRYFGRDPIPPVRLDVAGAEGLRKGMSARIGWLPVLALACLLVGIGSETRRRFLKLFVYALAVFVTFALPVFLRDSGVVSDPEAAMATLGYYFIARAWQRFRHRVRHTSVSGLPNLRALTAEPLAPGRDVVIMVIARYEEILATLPKDLHVECVRQIARRISVGAGSSVVHHGEGGHFAWTEIARPLDTLLGHLDGLRAMFSAPLMIGQHTFDTNIHFGVDRNEGLDSLTRVNSALASANEALSNCRAVEIFEAGRLAEAPWELSLHARIDEGLRNGDIWLAFQPLWDFAAQRICGAEALIRWNHPTRGAIAPDAFILQAERAGRIDALTYWVLERAITAALDLNALGAPFQMSINLSAQMVDKPDLVANLNDVVRRRGIDSAMITIEVTETSGVQNRAAARYNLSRLREMGFRLSIDDFGTGEASLTYLAELPSDELKLDRRFVSRMITHERERQIVRSTIELAHALGQTVVAEGIEDSATFALLHEMKCDHAQGYFIARPMPFEDMRVLYLSNGTSKMVSVHA